MIIAVIAWMDGSTRRQEALGPFEVREENSHLAEIHAALQEWRTEYGDWVEATLYAVTPAGLLPSGSPEEPTPPDVSPGR
jgi:hypothetical protein